VGDGHFAEGVRDEATTFVMPAHSRSKNGVASLAYVAGIHVFTAAHQERRGWPGQARP
jgi:hypothetical protein